MLYNNNDTIVTEDEFLRNPEIFIKGTIERKATLIILDSKTQEPLVYMNYKKFLGIEEDY